MLTANIPTVKFMSKPKYVSIKIGFNEINNDLKFRIISDIVREGGMCNILYESVVNALNKPDKVYPITIESNPSYSENNNIESIIKTSRYNSDRVALK